MPTAKKAAVIDDLTDKLGRINAAALIEYRGLTVAEIGDLRNQLRPRDVEITVTKNTLLRAAAHRNNMTELDDLFTGPNAVAFIYGDEAAGTKALNDYFRTSRVGEIKSGILKGGRRVSAEQFAKLADLPNRQTLLAQIAGLLESPLSQLASLFNAPAQQFAYALAAFEEKGGATATGVLGAPPAATAPDTAPMVTAPTPAPEATAVEVAAAATTSGAEVTNAAEPVAPTAPVIEAAAPSAPPIEDTVAVAPVAPVTDLSTPSAVESHVTGLADAMAGEDMSEPPIVPDVAPSGGDMLDTVPVTPQDAEDGAVDQIASPGAAETPDTATGRQAAASIAAPEATTSAPAAAEPIDATAGATTIAAVTPAVTEDMSTSAPVRITSSDAPIPTVAAASSQSQGAERAVADVSSAPESEGSAGTAPPATVDQAGPTLRFSASLPADTRETISGQEAAADPTSAPESEGSAP